MQPDTDIQASQENPIVDFESLAADGQAMDTVVDLSSLAMADTRPRSGFTLDAIRTKAPDLQIIARFSLPVMALLYFFANPIPPLLIPVPAIILVGVIFIAHQLYTYRRTRRSDIPKTVILSASQLDLTAAHLVWLFDPMIPAPMMLMVVIAAIGNGLQHGIRTFRPLLQIILVMTPVVIALRIFLLGFDWHCLPFLVLCAFLIVYAFFMVRRSDAIHADMEARSTDLELNNYKLKQLGMALQKSEARYRNIFDTSSAAMVLIEDNMMISLANEKFLALSKYSKSELYNKKKLSDFIDKDDLRRIQQFHSKRRKMGGTTPTEYECKMLDKNNHVKHIIIRFNITQWHERIMATIEDITSRKQARTALQSSIKKLRQTAARLTQSQKQYRNLFENTGTATILVEKNLRISMANSRFCELTGFAKTEIIGIKRLSEFIERKSLFRIRRFHAKQKEKGLSLPSEYECLMLDNARNLKHVVMKIYTPPGQENSIVSFFDITQRKQAEAALQAAHERLRVLAVVDELTQVANRRQFNEKLHFEWGRLQREGLPLSLIMCDVDAFKAYNDTYGHQNGDVCLRSIADAIKKTVKRSVDVVARYGGEEFAVIMPNTNHLGASKVAESVRMAVEDLQIPNKASSVSDFITLSLGVSSMIPTRDLSPEELIKEADSALYEAKKQGRNQVVLSKNAVPQGESIFSRRFSSPTGPGVSKIQTPEK